MIKCLYIFEILMITLIMLVSQACGLITETDKNRVAKPSFDPPGGPYEIGQVVSIFCSTPGAGIYYSVDGSPPTILYSEPITIDSTSVVKAIATRLEWQDSEVSSANYNIGRISMPTFSPLGGTYTTPQIVTISCETSGSTIRYTTDGSEPTSGSAIFTAPINVQLNTTLKAKVFKSGWLESLSSAAKYTDFFESFVYVPGGTFTMGDTHGVGSSNELPTHIVTLNSFYIGKYEVTQLEYSQYMQPGNAWISNHGLGDIYPAYNVSWYAILKYCNLRSMAEGLTPVYSISGSTNPANWGVVPTSSNSTWDAAICNWSANGYRLPTEAEWEYAARGATNDPDYLYSGSDDINVVAWYSGNNSPDGSKPVGTKAPNGLGLYDMSGNVYETCWDWYSSTFYNSSSSNNPHGPSTGSNRISRGGCWRGDAEICRVANRSATAPDSDGSYHVGIRLCRALL